MITRKQDKQIAEVWHDLNYMLNNLDWTSYGNRLLEETITESKQHDRFRGDSIQREMSINCEARYFAVKRVIEYIDMRFFSTDSNAPIDTIKPLEAKDYCMTQKSCFTAYCIAHNDRFADVRTKWLAKHGELAREIAAWNYCDLIAVETKQEVAA